MAFGGGYGIPGNMLAAACMRVPYGSTGLITYDSDGLTAMFSAGGEVMGRSRKLFHTLVLTSFAGEFIGQQAVPLSAFVDQSVDGSAVDTGVLVSAAPAANQHGLPINFGPGRDNWVTSTVERLASSLRAVLPSLFAAGAGAASIISVTGGLGPNARDIAIVVKNQAAVDLTTLQIRLRYDHTVIL